MNLEKELQEIGLQEKEARVYIAMLELGRATAQDIAKKADVNRATTYFVMENLMKKGLASAVDEGTKQYFLPEDPSQLEAIFEKKRIEFEAQKERVSALVSELSERNALKNKNPVVKYYLG
ncbi:MAG: helix-turn-helix domain-containing protein, partial [Candidatus Moraniibacteriota bacterium]